MKFDEVVRKRKMIRQYEFERPVPDYIVGKLIENVHRAPSAGHTQVQEFIIVKNSSIKSKLGDAAVGQRFPLTGTIEEIGNDTQKIKQTEVDHIVFGYNFVPIYNNVSNIIDITKQLSKFAR